MASPLRVAPVGEALRSGQRRRRSEKAKTRATGRPPRSGLVRTMITARPKRGWVVPDRVAGMAAGNMRGEASTSQEEASISSEKS